MVFVWIFYGFVFLILRVVGKRRSFKVPANTCCCGQPMLS